MNTYKINLKERKKCPLCKSKFKEIYSLSYNNKNFKEFFNRTYNCFIELDSPYTIGQCKKCSFLFQVNIPDNAGIKLLYEEIISSKFSFKKRLYANNSYFNLISKDIQRLKIIFKNKKPYLTKVLDFGLGWSNWAKLSEAHGYKVFGTEISRKRINFAKLNNIKCKDIEDYPSNFFNYINTDEVFEHIENPYETLQLLKNKLIKNGVIKIFVPNCSLFKYKKKSIIHKELSPLEHINGFTRNSIDQFMCKNGFKRIPPTVFMKNFTHISFALKQFFNTRGYFVKI